MTVQTVDPNRRQFLNMLAIDKVRLQDPVTRSYLHISGTGTSATVGWSWLGFRHQARTLRNRAIIRGEDFPFVMVDRENLNVIAWGQT